MACLVLRVVNPPVTPLMLIRVCEAWLDGRSAHIDQKWRKLGEISPNVVRAVIASEDAAFLYHPGVDWSAIEAAHQWNSKQYHTTMRGGSTITMQSVKNVFLWPGRNYVRKALEIYLAYVADFIWGKERVMEIYLNVIEWGDGIYGIDSAARHYFEKPARSLTPEEAAMLAVVIPNPREWSPLKPTLFLRRRQRSVLARMRAMGLVDLD